MKKSLLAILKNTLKVTIVTSLIGAAVPASASIVPNLISNGSFEAPFTTGNYSWLDAGSTFITAWTVVGGQVLLVPENVPGGGLPASDGRQWVDLTGEYGYEKGVRSAPIATIRGATYDLSFDIGTHYLNSYRNSSLTVSINNGTPQMFTNMRSDGNSPIMDWERRSLTWVADTTSANFTFLGAENGGSSNNALIGLDNVVFTETIPAPHVPEPETLALLASGILGLFVYRKKNTGK